MIEIFFLGFVVYYCTQVLIFDTKKAGPFLAKDAFVTWHEDGTFNRRPVAIFDRIRRVFGFYSEIGRDGAGNEIWLVDDRSSVLWQCPHCLGFWVSLLVALTATYFHQDPEFFILAWFATAGMNSFFVRFHES